MKTLFMTGATGCIGHYVLKALLERFPSATIHALVRDPKRFKFDTSQWPNLHCHLGTMDDIGKYQSVLRECDVVVHIATVWGFDLDVNLRINRDRTLEMLDYCSPTRLKKIIYFSTASILTHGNMVSPAAESEGTPYVQSKLAGYTAIKASKWANITTTLFPTMVLGGSETAPYSHISEGIRNVRQYLWWAKWLKIKGAFHFLHGEDIAKMVCIAITTNMPPDVVLGTNEQTFNGTIFRLCHHLGRPPLFQIPVPSWVIHTLVWLFKRRIDSWGRHCAKHPFFTYTTHSPSDFGEPLAYPTFDSVLKSMAPI
ncbi:MAG: NAD(P)-dependent oxidoreductase [Candidatus Margulisbacteria bacterium]|jgi:nucleoside-diphosphate-sugar epimerase|nr:NAD(P)-dependent oxidoreductase [Candidatus Margulisiibacteriota bacterium]